MEASKTRPHLGKFALVAEIARGGMGIVYLARVSGPAGFQKLSVIKQLKPEMVDDEKFLSMFMDEARLAARLNHRNIVQTNEVGEDAGRYYMAMEYLEGKTLQSVRTRLKGERALPAPMVVRIACEVLAGLHYAHELSDYNNNKPLGIVHRDVSPQNVFLTYDGQVKVLDFGVAKAYGRAQETEVGMLKGRVVCMSPEHVANDNVDRRADIFSMGVMLRETLTGKKVWESASEMDVIKSLLSKRVPPFPDDDGRIHPELRAIIEKAMEPHRDDRWSTAEEMRAALEEHVRQVDPGGSLTKLGEMIGREFADHRERVKALIEKHNAGVDADFFPGTELPVLPTSSPEIGTSSSSSSSSMASRSSFTSKPRSSMGTRSGGATVLAGEVPSGVSSVQVAPRRTGTVIGVVLVAVAVAIGGTVMVMRSRLTTPVATTAQDHSTPAVTSAAGGANTWVAVQPDVVELTVRATPATAQIFVDDAMVPDNPFKAKYPRGGSHTVRVVAPGHAPKTESLTLSESMSMSVSLDKTGPGSTAVIVAQPMAPRGGGHAPPSPPPVQTPTATPQPTPVAPPDIAPGGGKAPQRNIDQKNPYGN